MWVWVETPASLSELLLISLQVLWQLYSTVHLYAPPPCTAAGSADIRLQATTQMQLVAECNIEAHLLQSTFMKMRGLDQHRTGALEDLTIIHRVCWLGSGAATLALIRSVTVIIRVSRSFVF